MKTTISVVLLLGGAALSAQAPSGDTIEVVSPYERAGIQHADGGGRIVDPEGKPVAGARVILYGYQPYYWALPIAETRTDEGGGFELRDVWGEGRLGLWVLSPRGGAFAKQYRSITLVSGRRTELGEVAAFTEDRGSEFEGTTVRGTVRLGSGEGIRGAYVRLQSEGAAFDPGAFAFTGADGSFEIEARTGRPESLSLFLANRRLQVEHEDGVEKLTSDGRSWKLDLSRDLVLQHESFVGHALSGPEGTRFATSAGGTWRECGPSVCLASSKYGSGSAWVRGSLEGHLPVVQSAPDDAAFEFETWVPMELEVRGAGGPLAGVHVDVCLADEEGEPLWSLARLRADVEGTVAVRGDPEATYVVYVYGTGYRAARAVWRAGKRTVVRLQPCSATATFDLGGRPAKSVFVRPAGRFAPVAVAYPGSGRQVTLALAPGRYEVTRHGEDAVDALATDVPEGTSEVALEGDRRPTATVRLPGMGSPGDWWIRGSRSSIGGMVSKWMAHSGGGKSPVTRELVAVVEKIEEEPAGDVAAFRLRFPTSGRYTVFCGREGLDHRLFCDVHAAFGSSIELALPALDARLRGEIAKYPDSWKFGAQHGVAGPRLALLPDRARGTLWGALVALPDPATFELEHLPPGHYWLHHHLYQTGMFSSRNGVWGGTAVELNAGEPADVGKLAKGKRAKLPVHIVDAAGRDLSGRLRIRDRMYESWQKVVEEGTTLRNALDPIPEPPSVPVVDGRATLPRVRPGHVELIFSLPDGRAIYLERELAAEGETRIDVDAR